MSVAVGCVNKTVINNLKSGEMTVYLLARHTANIYTIDGMDVE